jgi:hypothetical protein
MFNFESIGRAALSAIGALVLTGTVVGAAVGPARVAETSPVAGVVQISAEANA